MPLPKSIGLPPLQLKLEGIPGFIIPCIGPNPLPLPAIATWSNQSDGRLRQHVNKIQTKLIIPRCRTHALRKVNHKLMVNKNTLLWICVQHQDAPPSKLDSRHLQNHDRPSLSLLSTGVASYFVPFRNLYHQSRK